MRTISLGIPELILEEIDNLIAEKRTYENRSDVLRRAIEDLLESELEHYRSKKLNKKP